MSYSFESAERAFKDGQIRDLSHHAQGMRFLKLRSLSRKEHLNRIIADHDLQIPEGRPAARLKDLFESDITDAQIDATIRAIFLEERVRRAVSEGPLITVLTKPQNIQTPTKCEER